VKLLLFRTDLLGRASRLSTIRQPIAPSIAERLAGRAIDLDTAR